MNAEIHRRIHNDTFRAYVRDLLIEICAIDTTPDPDIAVMRSRESAVLDVLERELGRLKWDNGRCERRAIDPAIQHHPAYSQLHFTKTSERPDGLAPSEAYAERCNLLFFADGNARHATGTNLAINAHIDVVAPYYPPREEAGVVYGRGACDDKGNVVAILAALKVLGEYLADHNDQLNRHVTAMFVIEEETGGNGSLSLALDHQLKERYDTLVVMECCDNRIYPANRGAVWYRFDLLPTDVSQFEMSSFVIEELEEEGRAIRTESRHSLFPQRPVQTCHGVMDHFGEHPSRICGHVACSIDFGISPNSATEHLIRDCVDSAIVQYTGAYGDKTKTDDPETGVPKVECHYRLRKQGTGFQIDVYGSTGHMGAILENDGAITKMATIVRALVRSKQRIEELAGSACKLELADRAKSELLILEGGQGFVPTHPIEEVMARMERAARRGAQSYLDFIEYSGPVVETVRGSFDKLHNAAFDGDPDSDAMQRAVAVATKIGTWPEDQPLIGWTVSCDARLFANEYPDMPVLTTGAGILDCAHSDDEFIQMDDLLKSIEFLAEFTLAETGTTPPGQPVQP